MTMPFSHPILPTGIDAIRILELEPGDFLSPLVGKLTSVTFRDKPRYVALSYTWGHSYPENSELPVSVEDNRGTQVSSRNPSPARSRVTLSIAREDRRSSSENKLAVMHSSDPNLAPATDDFDVIMLNGRPLSIRHNLHLALLHLRSPTHSLTIWIDAICIDQDNIEERSRQVSIMAFIYTRAIKVVAWLGTKHYLPMSGLFRSMSLEWKAGHTQHFATSFTEGTKPHLSPTPNRSTIAHIFKSNYWKRLWIVQEICLPRHLVFAYGSDIWTFEELKNCRSMLVMPQENNYGQAAFKLLEIRDQRHTDKMRLENLIEIFADNECSESKDRIYGLIGCANDIRPVKGQEDGPVPLKTQVVSVASNVQIPHRPELGMGSIEVNYHLSCYEIWTSVVNSIYRQARVFEQNVKLQDQVLVHDHGREVSQSEERKVSIVRTAGIAQAALGQKIDEEVTNYNILHEPPTIKAIGYIAGEILQIGPDYVSLVSLSSANHDWASCWTNHYEKEKELARLRWINEEYMAKILDYKPSDIARVRDIRKSRVTACRYGGVAPAGYRGHNEENDVIQNSPRSDDHTPRICLGTGFTMGLVPPATALRDVVVRFWNCDAAVIMRPITRLSSGEPDLSTNSFTLVGRADIAETVEHEPGSHTISLWNTVNLPGSKEGSAKSGPVEIDLDRKTLQMITAHIATKNERRGLL